MMLFINFGVEIFIIFEYFSQIIDRKNLFFIQFDNIFKKSAVI